MHGFQESTSSPLKCCAAHVHQSTLLCSLSGLLVLHEIRLRITGFFRCNGYNGYFNTFRCFCKKSKGALKFHLKSACSFNMVEIDETTRGYKMKIISISLILALMAISVSCTRERSIKSPCVAAGSAVSGKNFLPCVRKPVTNVFLV